MSRRFSPEDALRLWVDPDRIGRACHVHLHPGYRQGRQTTRAFGRLMVEELRDLDGVEGLRTVVADLVNLPVTEFSAKVPTVEVKFVPKKKVPTDDDAGDDAIGPVRPEVVEKRPIVVPPLVRRALSIHLSEILETTGDYLLPTEAIAYRPGRRQVVQRAILDVARAVRGGAHYWAKLDVRSFFPTVPWAGIETTLKSYGYPEAFVGYSMALVRGGVAKRESWRTWVPVETDAGTQAGLRESSIIANLYLSGLDRVLLSKFKGDLFYRRYSDDMLMMGRTKEVVRKAVVEVETWIESRGLTLKGVAP